MSSWSGTEIGEFLQRAKRLVDLAGLLHPVGVLEEVLPGVALEALLRADLAELVVDRRAARRMAQDLVAERDGVVEEAALGVQVDRLLVVVERLGDVALPHEHVADAIEQRHILVVEVLPSLVEDLDVHRERLVELLLLLELGGCLLRDMPGRVDRPTSGRHAPLASTGDGRRTQVATAAMVAVPVRQLADVVDRRTAPGRREKPGDNWPVSAARPSAAAPFTVAAITASASRHAQLAHRQREDEREVRRGRRAGIEVGGQGDGSAAFDQGRAGAWRSLPRNSMRAREQRRDRVLSSRARRCRRRRSAPR